MHAKRPPKTSEGCPLILRRGQRKKRKPAWKPQRSPQLLCRPGSEWFGMFEWPLGFLKQCAFLQEALARQSRKSKRDQKRNEPAADRVDIVGSRCNMLDLEVGVMLRHVDRCSFGRMRCCCYFADCCWLLLMLLLLLLLLLILLLLLLLLLLLRLLLLLLLLLLVLLLLLLLLLLLSTTTTTTTTNTSTATTTAATTSTATTTTTTIITIDDYYYYYY